MTLGSQVEQAQNYLQKCLCLVALIEIYAYLVNLNVVVIICDTVNLDVLQLLYDAVLGKT